MNQLQESKNSSYKTLDELFTTNATVLATLPATVKIIGDFRANCLEIDSLIARQGVNRSGLKNNKEILRDAAIVAGLDVAKRITAYATVEENAILLKEAKLTETELRRLADTKIAPKLTAVVTLANANAAKLAEYGVTAAVITKLSEAIQAYATAVPQPKMGIDETKQVTNKLDECIKSNDALLRKMDALVELEKAGNPVFYNSYKNLRKVVVLGKGSLALKGLIRDAVTGKGIPKVDVLIEPSGERSKALMAAGADLSKNVKRTAPKGNFMLKTLPEGEYTFTISKPGYAPQVKTVNVIAGELCNVVVELVSN